MPPCLPLGLAIDLAACHACCQLNFCPPSSLSYCTSCHHRVRGGHSRSGLLEFAYEIGIVTKKLKTKYCWLGRVIRDRLKENGRRAKEDLGSAHVCAVLVIVCRCSLDKWEREQKGVMNSGGVRWKEGVAVDVKRLTFWICSLPCWWLKLFSNTQCTLSFP